MPRIDRVPKPEPTTVRGERVYLGKADADHAADNYIRFLNLWRAAGHTWSDELSAAYKRGDDAPPPLAGPGDRDGPSVAEVAARYLDWSAARYVKRGKPVGSYYTDRSAIKALLATPGLSSLPMATL